MRKLFLISATAVMLSALLLSANVTNADKSTSKQNTYQSSAQGARKVLYVMKTYGEEIGVFKPNEKEPLYTLNEVHVKSLPQYDQNLLNTGIKIYSEKELKSLIEDYDS